MTCLHVPKPQTGACKDASDTAPLRELPAARRARLQALLCVWLDSENINSYTAFMHPCHHPTDICGHPATPFQGHWVPQTGLLPGDVHSVVGKTGE